MRINKIQKKEGFLDFPVQIQIFQFIHPYYFKTIDLILRHLNSIATLEHFQNVYPANT